MIAVGLERAEPTRGDERRFRFVGSSTAMAVGGTTLVHCGGPGGEDRAAHLTIPSGALAPSLNLNSSLNSSLNSTLGSIGTAAADTAATWPPTLWQYPATAAGG